MTPGLHSISSEQYHAAAGVSRSMLGWLTPPRTPLHFWAKYIAKLIPDEETPAMQLGTVTHRAILEPDTMDNAFYVRPEGMSFTTKEGKAWRDEHNGRPILSAADASAIKGMRDAVWSHPMAARLLKDADFERSAFADDKGFLLKARFDALPRTGNAIVDIKTCERADLDNVEKAMAQYAYFIQDAFYSRVANLIGRETAGIVFVFVEKSPPYAVACYSPIDTVREVGRMMVSRDLHLLRGCYESGQWPGYGNGVQACGLPPWMMKQLEAIA